MLDVYRKEIKYIVSVVDFARMKSRLDAYLTLDPHSGREGYLVRSLYFDSEYDDDMRDVLDGLFEKSKTRLRIYGPEDKNVKLEFKQKAGGDGRKQTLIIGRSEAQQMMRTNYSFLLDKPEPFAARCYRRMALGAYRPKVIVEYRRFAYLYLNNDIRITFDSNVSSCPIVQDFFKTNLPKYPLMPPDLGVLEVKYDGFLPTPFKKALGGTDALATSNSKYLQARL
ncbi:MAG: polyphosphate polymerase domain-containing protein [Oscillospiraceae bacterium]